MSHRARESFPPDTATRTRSPGRIMLVGLDRPIDLLAAVAHETGVAEAGVVAPYVDHGREPGTIGTSPGTSAK